MLESKEIILSNGNAYNVGILVNADLIRSTYRGFRESSGFFVIEFDCGNAKDSKVWSFAEESDRDQSYKIVRARIKELS